jgi:hypothetical protein
VNERLWRASEMVAALKARGGKSAELFAEDLDGIEHRLLLGMLDPMDEASVETVYYGTFGETFDEALMRPRGDRAAQLRAGQPEGALPTMQPHAAKQA